MQGGKWRVRTSSVESEFKDTEPNALVTFSVAAEMVCVVEVDMMR